MQSYNVMHPGPFTPVITALSVSAVSIAISWTQPEFSLPVNMYRVSMTRVTGSGQVLCQQYNDTQKPALVTTDTMATFTGLEEFSVYNIIVTASFNEFSASESTGQMEFTTFSDGN